MPDEEKGQAKEQKKQETITVAGITFSAEQVKNATVEVDGREIYIGEKEDRPRDLGFK